MPASGALAPMTPPWDGMATGSGASSGLPSRKAGAQDDGQSLAGSGGLPRRQAGASIAPQLRERHPGKPGEPVAGRSPEQARKLMSAIQQGLQSSRANTPTGRVTNQGTANGGDEQ
jgi:hypothetical protein